MTSEELADEVTSIVEECRVRVLGIGKEQYSEGEHQRFETMHMDDLFEYAEEELRDLVVYACMLRIRLRRLRNSVRFVSGRVAKG